MANRLYDLGRKYIAEAGLNWLTDNIKALLATNTYVPNSTTDQYLSIIPGGSILSTSVNFTGKTDAAGALNAANITFTAVSGAQVLYLVIYKDTGVAGTSPLLVLIDTGTNLPVTPSGGDIQVQWQTSSPFIAIV